MKKMIVAVTVGFLTIGTLAQGWFYLDPCGVGGGPVRPAKVTLPDGTPLSGADYWAQVYVGKSLDSLVPVGTPVNFLTGPDAGCTPPPQHRNHSSSDGNAAVG
jgi:hypothetical protein